MVYNRDKKSCQKSPCHRVSLRHYNCTTRCHDNKSLYRVVKYCIIRKIRVVKCCQYVVHEMSLFV